MNRILFRCDASLSLGSGHMIRCRTLARCLLKRKTEIIFVCREKDGDMRDLISDEFKVVSLPKCKKDRVSTVIIDNQKNKLEKDILGCSELEDAIDTAEELNRSGYYHANWVIVDHYGLSEIWENIIAEEMSLPNGKKPRILAIDDLANRRHSADILLDQATKIAAEKRYGNLIEKNANT